ncbi:MAG: DUF167 domain-containing protein [Chitinophagales bacterium]|nr:DUF167 domain-containing protein [Chitinophagales bacterium]
MFLHIKAKPGSKMNQISIAADGSFIIKIKAPAHDGKANDELLKFLSTKLGLPKSKIQLVSGFTSPFKKLQIDADESVVIKNLTSN